MAKTWSQEDLDSVLSRSGFDELYRHIEDRVFSDYEIVVVPSQNVDYEEDWRSRKMALVGGTRAISTPASGLDPSEFIGGKLEDCLERTARREGIDERVLGPNDIGSLEDRNAGDEIIDREDLGEDEVVRVVEIYPDSYEEVRPVRNMGGVELRTASEVLGRYRGRLPEGRGIKPLRPDDTPVQFYIIQECQE